MRARLEATGLRFGYGRRLVLDDVTLAVGDGELVGVLGPNGSGKSTLLRLLAGMLRPQTGAVGLDGTPLATLGRRALARRLGYVPQDPHVDFPFSALEVVLMGRAPHQRGFGLPAARDLALAREALALLDAAPLATRAIDELSGGERQRVFLARALAQEPAVLLLDEPTTHLDLHHQIGVHEVLLRLMRERRLAAVAALHDVNVAAAYCARVLLLREGRVVAWGPTGEVLTPGRIAAVYDVTVHAVIHPTTGATLFVPDARLPGPRLPGQGGPAR